MKVGITRWGGSVSFLQSEVYASNANNIDYWFIRSLCTCGIKLVVLTRPSTETRNCLENKDSHSEWEPWMNNIECRFDWKKPDVSDIDVLLIQQGSENLRITGEHGISSQFFVYRIMRDFKGAVFYLGYDAYIPLHVVTETRLNNDQKYYTCTTKEFFHKKSLNILCPGNMPNLYSSLYESWGVHYPHIKMSVFKRDTHDLMYPILDQFDSLYEYGTSTSDRMAFIGKDRNGGSRYQFFMDSTRRDPRIQLDLYGDWGKSDFMEQLDKTIFWHGKIGRGVMTVLDTYNSHICSPLIANERYVESNQFTARVFEVLASKTLPLIEESWGKKFREYLPDEVVSTLSFNTKNLGEKYQMVLSNKDWAVKMAKYVREKFKSVFIQDNPFKEVLELMVYATTASLSDGPSVMSEILDYQYQKDKDSKFSRTRLNADENSRALKEFYSGPPTTTQSSIKNVYGFADSQLDEASLLEYFNR